MLTPTHRRLLFALLALAAIATLVWYASRPEPLAVSVATVERGLVEATVANTRAGTVNACHRAGITPTIGGQVARLLVDEGDAVEAGQLLLELWNDDLKAQLALARSEADSARAQSEEACLLAEVAAREARRVQRMFAQELASEEQRDRTQTDARARAAACQGAKARAAVSANRITLAEANLARTRLQAPFSGTVAEITGEPGEYVTPSPPGIPTPPAIDLVDTSCLYVSAPIDEVDAPAIEVGMPVRISLDAFAGQPFAGRVKRIAPYVLDLEKQARTVDVEASFTNPEALQKLLPGYSADVEIILAAREQTLRLPTEAIVEGNRVYVYRPAAEVLEVREIETGLSNWQYTEVLSGLEAGEQVVVSVGREGVADGTPVRIEERAGR